MLLTVDIGNTNITLGIFDGNNIIRSWRLATNLKRTEDEYGVFLKNLLKEDNLNEKVKAAVISSVVVQLTERIEIALKKYLKINSLIISHKTKSEVTLKIDEPSQMGADRIVNAAAAAKLYKLPAIVVDFGTATTFDVINKNKEFVGGIIAAGMKIQADALSDRTSKLPKLFIEEVDTVLATNTIDAMLAGVVRGHAAMIDGLIKACEEELGEKTTIIATGGYSSVISKYLKRKFDDINPDLTLIGAKILYDLNLENKK